MKLAWALVGIAIPVAIVLVALLERDWTDQVFLAGIMSVGLMPLSAKCINRARRKAVRGDA